MITSEVKMVKKIQRNAEDKSRERDKGRREREREMMI